MRQAWASLVLAAAGWAAAVYACSNTTPRVGDNARDASTDGPLDALADVDASIKAAAADARPCGPLDAAAFAPTWPSRWRPPAPFGQKVCQPAQIQAYVADCLGTGNPNPHLCTATLDASASDLACYECIFPDAPDAAPGPLVSRDCGILVNLAGCLANATNDPDASGCVGAWLSAEECASSACASCACGEGLTDQRTPCSNEVRDGGCAVWQSAASCIAAYTLHSSDASVDASSGPSLAAQCVTTPTTSDALYAYISLFCSG